MITTIEKTERGFEYVTGIRTTNGDEVRLQQSSAIGNYDDSLGRPGTSYVWLFDVQLDREAAAALGSHLMQWAGTGSFAGLIEETP